MPDKFVVESQLWCMREEQHLPGLVEHLSLSRTALLSAVWRDMDLWDEPVLPLMRAG